VLRQKVPGIRDGSGCSAWLRFRGSYTRDGPSRVVAGRG
jgi:hypothetical protein